MSADNWTTCPRCTEKEYQRIADLELRVSEGYGVLPLEEFDALREEVRIGPRLEETFRENYDFYGADEGLITASYSGWCTACTLSAKFKYEYRFWPNE